MGKIVGLIFPDETAAEIFRCPHCEKEYKSAQALEKHLREKHPDGGEQ